MTQHEFRIRLIDLETYVIKCEEFINLSDFRTEIKQVAENVKKYKEKDYAEIISRGRKKLERLIGKETYERMFVIKTIDFSKNK